MNRGSPDDEIIRFGEAKQLRNPHEQDWRLAAMYCKPRSHGKWLIGGGNPTYASTGAQTSRLVYDQTGVNSLPKWVAILQRIATPMSQRWQQLAPSDPYLLKNYRVKVFFEQLTDRLFKMREHPKANFTEVQTQTYEGLGLYAFGPKYIGWRKPTPQDPRGGFFYRACHASTIYLLLDDEGNVDTVYRQMWLTARQFKMKWPDEKAPQVIAAELSKAAPSEIRKFEIVHVCRWRKSYDKERLDHGRHPIQSSYLCIEGKEWVGEEEGFSSWAFVTPVIGRDPGDIYGYAPATQALTALGTASVMKKTALKQGQKAVDPVLLTHDDGVLNTGGIDLRPGRVVTGAVNAQGQRLVQTMEMGNFKVAEMMLTDERRDIEDAFLVYLFKFLAETPEMTATQVIEIVKERASILAPTMGMMQHQDLGPQTEREISLLDEHKMLPEVPPELVEAQGEYSIVYTSPLAKGAYAEEVSGFWSTVETSLNVAQATQDPSKLDHFDFDTAIPEIAERRAVPARWMASPEKLQATREGRQEQVEQQQMIDAAPAASSMMATAAKMQQGGAAPRGR